MPYWSSAERGNRSFFMKRAGSIAVEVNKGEIALAKTERKSEGQLERGNDQIGNNKSRKLLNLSKYRVKVTQETPGTSNTKQDADKNTRVQRKEWIQHCLNPRCTLKDPIKDCKASYAEERKRLLK